MSFRVEVLTDPARVTALVPEWDALAVRDHRTTPYDSGTLMTSLGAIDAGAGAPYIVTARVASGALAGVLPLRRVRTAGRLGGHKLIAYPGWHASYFDASADPAYPEVGRTLIDTLPEHRDWEQCDLQYLRPDGNLCSATTDRRLRLVAASHLVEERSFSLGGDGGVMAHKSARRLAKAGEIAFLPVVPDDELAPTIRRFAELHTQRWRGHGDSAEFVNPETVDRLIRTMQQLAGPGVGRVGCLKLSGAIVAVHLAFRWRDAQYSWRMAHDAQWQAMSPGRLLMSLMIEEALTTGCRSYDLGRGDEGYKQLWPTTERPLYRLSFSGSSWRARFAALRART